MQITYCELLSQVLYTGTSTIKKLQLYTCKFDLGCISFQIEMTIFSLMDTF